MTPCVSSGHRVFWVSIPEKFKARLRVPITVKKCHDFYKGKYLVGAGLEWSIVSMARSVAAHGPTWCWRSWEFHIQTFKQQEERTAGPGSSPVRCCRIAPPSGSAPFAFAVKEPTERKPQAAGSNQEKNKPRIDLLLLLLRWVRRRREIYLRHLGLSWYFPVKNTLQITLELLFRDY